MSQRPHRYDGRLNIRLAAETKTKLALMAEKRKQTTSQLLRQLLDGLRARDLPPVHQ